MRRLGMVTKKKTDKVRGSGEEKDNGKDIGRGGKQKANRCHGRGSQNNLIFKMEESKQLALSSEVKLTCTTWC